MEVWDRIDEGWGKNLKYGAGLELEFGSHAPAWRNLTRHIGHAGTTYGFQSLNAFFPGLNISVSLTLNSDHTLQKRVTMCGILQIYLRRAGNEGADLECSNLAVLGFGGE